MNSVNSSASQESKKMARLSNYLRVVVQRIRYWSILKTVRESNLKTKPNAMPNPLSCKQSAADHILEEQCPCMMSTERQPGTTTTTRLSHMKGPHKHMALVITLHPKHQLSQCRSSKLRSKRTCYLERGPRWTE